MANDPEEKWERLQDQFNSLLDENERLRQRVRELKEITATDVQEIESLQKQVAKLEDALLEMRMTADAESKDAERYRWLRNFSNFAVANELLNQYDTLDAAIDAAMEADDGE